MRPDPATLAASRQFVTELMTGAWRSQALYCAVRLQLADHIERGLTAASALAAASGASEDGIRRLMRLLVSIGIFTQQGDGDYRNTPMGAAILNHPSSLRDMCLLYGEECYRAWGHALDSVRTASSGFRLAFGEDFYNYLGRNEIAARRFQNVMNAGSPFFDVVAERVKPGANALLVDVGGGGGELLATMLQANPDSRGVFFDRDHMIAGARSFFSELNLAERIEFVGGDMFKGIPLGGDMYFFSRVFAGWADDDIIPVLSGCLKRMRGPGSRAILIDRLISDDDQRIMPALWDLQLLMTIGGRLRTLNSFRDILSQAGFAIERIEDLPGDYTAVIAAPTA